ncbi:hypothetical protein V8B97DRAFT_1988723 [Scleroderma yunnanense]
MAPQKSLHSPTKGTSTSHHAATPQASWMDGDIDTLLDLVITHKASPGEGMNFKAIFWNTVSTTLANPTKGGSKTAKVCKEKWKRLRKTFDVIDQITNTSGFVYSLQSGANISLENEAIPFCNKGWLHYKKMKQLMPSKGKGLNCFSMLSLSKLHSTDGNRLSTSTSDKVNESEHGKGSTSTVVECSNNGQSTLCTGTNNIEISYPPIEPFIPSAPEPASTFHVPASFPPPPPSLLILHCTPPSSSVSACIECSRKQKADGEDSLVISSSLSALKTSTSLAQK